MARRSVIIASVAAAVAIAAALIAVIRDDGGEGSMSRVASATERSPYLGPKGGGKTWVRSRPKRLSIIWAAGDGANGSADSRSVASLISSSRVDRFLYLGDVYEAGTARDFNTNYGPVYGQLNAVTAPTIGNHEWANLATGYAPYWTAARGAPPPQYYSFVASGWQLISVNSNLTGSSGDAQLDWLRSLISDTKRVGDCRIVFMHFPFFSAGSHGDTEALQAMFDAIEGHATLALAGHDHDMQRLKPVGGVTQIVSGAGGEELYPVNTADPRLAFSDATHHGALRMKLRPGSSVVSFVAEDGSLLDRSTVRCEQSG